MGYGSWVRGRGYENYCTCVFLIVVHTWRSWWPNGLLGAVRSYSIDNTLVLSAAQNRTESDMAPNLYWRSLTEEVRSPVLMLLAHYIRPMLLDTSPCTAADDGINASLPSGSSDAPVCCQKRKHQSPGAHNWHDAHSCDLRVLRMQSIGGHAQGILA